MKIAASSPTLQRQTFAKPGLQLITTADLKYDWRSAHYSELSNNVLPRPAIVIEQQ